MLKRLVSIATIALLAIVVLTACGTQDEEEAQQVTRIPVANAPSEGSPAAEVETASPAAPPADAAADEPAEEGASADASTVTMGMPSELAFEPSEFTIPANTDVTLNLPNEGAQPHNFSIDELDISVDAGPGEAPTTTINAAPGEYAFYCDIPGHKEGGMVGTLIVE